MSASPTRPTPRGRLTRRRPPAGRAILVILGAIVLFAAGGGGVAWWLSVGRLPLRGPSQHDFGTVALKGDDVVLTHAFELRNTRSEPLMIQTIRPNCGCASGNADRNVIAPGETVTITGQLALDAAGGRKASLTVIFEGGEMQRLTMQAIAQRDRMLRLEPATIMLRAGEMNQLLAVAQIAADVEPPAPELEFPSGVSGSWLGWTKASDADPERGTAHRWRGRVSIDVVDAAAVVAGNAVVVVLPDAGDANAPSIRAVCRILGVSGAAPDGQPGDLGFSGSGDPRPVPFAPPSPPGDGASGEDDG